MTIGDKMVVKINYGNKVVVLPASVMDAISNASALDVKILMALASNITDDDCDLKSIAERLGIEVEELIKSLDFWQDKGVIGLSESLKKEESANKSEAKERSVTRKVLQKADETPRYTTEELSLILEK